MLPHAIENDECTVLSKMPHTLTTQVEPIGRWFEAYCVRRHHKQTLSYHSINSSSSEDEEELSDEDEEDENLLRSLDPKEWKNQDHYMVLGLAKLRYEATAEQIKKAYKKKVLKHHPDKRKARGIVIKEGDDDYFTCVTRAYETLGIPVKRKAYDSVDSEFDDAVPDKVQDPKQFHKTFHPAFMMNARWSNKKNVPSLGDDKATFEHVNNFYSFWYEFDSWRTYEYLDEEEKEKGENRDERRWIDKQNKAARTDRKKKETARVRKLVDNAYASDPRIARFKEEEKAQKLAKKQAKIDAAKQKVEEEERLKKEAEEAQRKIQEEENRIASEQAAAIKKEKEAQKTAMKKQRKIMRGKLKDYEYFASDDSEKVLLMQEVDKLAEMLSFTSIQALNVDLTGEDINKAKQTFLDKVQEVNAEIQAQTQRHLAASTRKASPGPSSTSSNKGTPWSDTELQLLVKAVALFPAGTVQRWDVMASFLEQHHEGSKRTGKEVLFKAKELQKMDMSALKEKSNEKAYASYAATHKASDAADNADGGISERFDSAAVLLVAETGSNPAPWLPEEQKILEQALRTYPASTPERWERISETIPARSKKDCMKRYKELVEMVKAKKAAAAAVKNK